MLPGDIHLSQPQTDASLLAICEPSSRTSLCPFTQDGDHPLLHDDSNGFQTILLNTSLDQPAAAHPEHAETTNTGCPRVSGDLHRAMPYCTKSLKI